MAGSGSALLFAFTAAPATSDAAFSAVAAADGVRTTSTDPSVVPLGAAVDGGAPSAQATVDSLGNSRAFASYPYPGDLAVSLPGTARGAGPPVPDYPAYAASSNEGPTKADVTSPAGYSLHAESDDSSSSAAATGGMSGEGRNAGFTDSRASVTVGATAITAAAEATAEAFAAAGVLRIGRVHSKATAVRHADGHLERSSETEVGHMTVAGQAVGLTEAGLVAPGSTQALPDASPAVQILRQAGVTVTYLAPVTSADGVVAAGVQVSATQPDGTGGTATTVFTMGRVSAFVSGTVPGGGTVDADPVVVDDGFTSVEDVVATGSESFVVGPAVVVDEPPAPSISPITSDPPAPSPGLSVPSVPLVDDRPIGNVSSASLYLILVVAAVAAAAGIQMIRILGVRFSWS